MHIGLVQLLLLFSATTAKSGSGSSGLLSSGSALPAHLCHSSMDKAVTLCLKMTLGRLSENAVATKAKAEKDVLTRSIKNLREQLMQVQTMAQTLANRRK